MRYCVPMTNYGDLTETREEMYAQMVADQYTDWCAAQTPALDPEADGSRDLYTEACVRDHEAQMREADLENERWAWEAEARADFYDYEPSPYSGDYSEM